MKKEQRLTTARLCFLAMLTAIFVLLDYFGNLTLPIFGGVLKITLAGLPVVLAALLFGPFQGAAVGLIGAFLGQMISAYGLSITTPLWIAPAMVRGLLAGFLFISFKKRAQIFPVAVCIIVSSLAVTGCNILAQYLDALILGYAYEPLLLLGYLLKTLNSVITAVVMTVITLPIYRGIRKAAFLK